VNVSEGCAGKRRDDAQAKPLVDQPIEVIGVGHRHAARRRRRDADRPRREQPRAASLMF
jgi:hypothetical protein